MPDDASDLKRLLLELYRSGRPLFDELQWEFESARWKELLAYAVAVNAKLELGFARDLVETLDRLKLTSAAALATISAADLWLVEQIALRAGCDPESARLALDALTGCSKAVNAEHGGLIQRFLRKHGDAMVGELEASLAAAGLPPAAARKTGALWLQNVANIPVLLPPTSSRSAPSTT